ncbi:beta-1:4-mannosyltransferase egh-like protein [Leptotrombidium deliense]|uniref:Beta-1:4-mannosyltransferase egh-like protein n=1 Tax=Leptotrombidium deliense TaxID=299467 RepID=A0A443RY59_9ACAR|nr:beta-1:4-mannosyltransferase egh-like protein [Leptotrombidium deliense]
MDLFNFSFDFFTSSFIVARVGAEREVGFDFGFDSSIAEDNFFGLKATSMGFKFDFVEGEMIEKSAFTFSDFLKQRTRWGCGHRLVVTSNQIPFKFKFIYIIQYFASFYGISAIVYNQFRIIYPLPSQPIVDSIQNFTLVFSAYCYFFGAVKQFQGKRYFLTAMLRAVFQLCFPLTVLVECYAFVASLFIRKIHFYIVKKEIWKPENTYEIVPLCKIQRQTQII